jgi:hypothetical protein
MQFFGGQLLAVLVVTTGNALDVAGPVGQLFEQRVVVAADLVDVGAARVFFFRGGYSGGVMSVYYLML